MSISAIKNRCRRYLIAAIGCLIFGIVYELFSHHVYSVFMLGAFLVPLLGGCFTALFTKLRIVIAPQVWAGGILWLTLGCIFKGVLDIYGTTNHLLTVFFIIGLLQLVCSLLLGLLSGAHPDGSRMDSFSGRN